MVWCVVVWRRKKERVEMGNRGTELISMTSFWYVSMTPDLPTY